VLHRYRIVPPEGGLFIEEQRAWWTTLPVSALEQVRIQSDLATLTFAEEQIVALEQGITAVAAADERVPLLLQLVGINVVGAITILAAIGEIGRFRSAAQLVGYAGLGASVHASGQTHTSGRISKAGRRDLRTAMIDAARSASRFHPHWRAELARLEPRLGYSKALIAIARKLLVAV
jgi:transposase